MKNICIALFVILLLQSTKAGESTTDTATAVTLISGTDYCSAFVYKCVATGTQNDGTNLADSVTFAWTLTIDSQAQILTENTDYWVKSDTALAGGSGATDATATSYIIFRPKLFTNITAGKNIVRCTQTQKKTDVAVGTATSKATQIYGESGSALTVAKADATCAAAPVLTLTESSGCTTIEAFIKDGVAADDKMYVLGADTAVAGPSTLAISKTYTVVAIKKNVVANTVTTLTLGASANCLITAADVSQKTDPCNVQAISFEYTSVASSTVVAAVSKTTSNTTTSIADTKYYVQEVTPATGKSKSVVIVQSKTFAASDVANISLGFQKDNVLRLGSKSVTMGSSVQTTCDSKAMTSAFSDDCQTNTISASAATTVWTYYGLDTTFAAPGTAADNITITKKGIYIADLSTTGNTPVIKQEYLQVTDTDCVKITQASTQTSTDRCAAMSFTCVSNLTSPQYAWTNSPSTATLSTTVNAAALTIPANTFSSTDNTKQTLKCTVNTSKDATLDITLVATACSSGNGNGSGSGDDDDSSSILSILALLLVALLL